MAAWRAASWVDKMVFSKVDTTAAHLVSRTAGWKVFEMAYQSVAKKVEKLVVMWVLLWAALWVAWWVA